MSDKQTPPVLHRDDIRKYRFNSLMRTLSSTKLDRVLKHSLGMDDTAISMVKNKRTKVSLIKRNRFPVEYDRGVE